MESDQRCRWTAHPIRRVPQCGRASALRRDGSSRLLCCCAWCGFLSGILTVQDLGRQFQFRLGDGTDRRGAGFRARLQQSFGPATGPTAWEPPLYPYLTAGVFLVFGIYSKASAFVLLALNSVFSALTCIPIFLIARRIFSKKVAVGSAWAWALLPNVMFWCTRAVWETSLAALLLTTIFWLALTLEDRDGWMPWFQFGLLWGITALSSTSLLSFLPAAGLWAWYRRARRGKKSLARGCAGVGGFLRVHRALAGAQL